MEDVAAEEEQSNESMKDDEEYQQHSDSVDGDNDMDWE